MLEGDYMLMESELSAARDRISKLITHLQKLVGFKAHHVCIVISDALFVVQERN